MKNFHWFKIYILIIIIISFGFVGCNIWAEVVETDWVLKEYLKEIKDKDCPGFVDVNVNALTMKDECTGLVWARHELPTYYDSAENLETAELEPGYTWQEAYDACADLEPAGMFRLPTVEELLTLVEYQCDDSSCKASLDESIVDGQPFFSQGIYWAINDFNEPDSWRDPKVVPPGNEMRDYKRSVNLLNSEVDTPVFGKGMRLNAWCVVDRTPEVIEKKFIEVITSSIDNGQAVTGGILKTVYNRKCDNYDSDCKNDQDISIGDYCDDIGFCAQDESVSITERVVDCSDGNHVEGNTCVINANDEMTWQGSKFNGYRLPFPDDTDEDGVADSLDNCPGISNPNQDDVDGDGIGDLCDDCYDYKGSCVELEVTQLETDFSAKIRPYVTEKSASGFYCYGGECDDSTTSCPNSSNVVEYDMVYPDRSNIFAYIDGSDDMMSLGFIHDVPNIGENNDCTIILDDKTDEGGGRVKFDFSRTGWDMAVVAVADDDGSEFSADDEKDWPADWEWFKCCTDGGMFEIANLDTSWSMIIEPKFIDGIDSWFLKEPGPDGVYEGQEILDLTKPVIISYTPPSS